jgi:hypothetical protein
MAKNGNALYNAEYRDTFRTAAAEPHDYLSRFRAYAAA